MNYWLLVYPRRLQDLMKELVAAMKSVCGPIGMHVNAPALVELKDDRIETYVRTIRGLLGSEVGPGGILQGLGSPWKKGGVPGGWCSGRSLRCAPLQDKVQLLLCITSKSKEDLYSAIKKLCCVQTPVPSQVGAGRSSPSPRGGSSNLFFSFFFPPFPPLFAGHQRAVPDGPVQQAEEHRPESFAADQLQAGGRALGDRRPPGEAHGGAGGGPWVCVGSVQEACRQRGRAPGLCFACLARACTAAPLFPGVKGAFRPSPMPLCRARGWDSLGERG